MESREHAHLFVHLVAVAAAAVLCAPPAGAQEPLAIAGTSVTLTPPPGFTRAARGVQNAAGSSITISERPAAAYAELSQTFGSARELSQAYAAQGVTIRSVRQIDSQAGRAQFASGTQNDKGRSFTKYFALLPGDKTVLVTFTIVDRGFTEADAEAVVRSIVIAPAARLEEQLAALSFTFSAVEPFRVAEVSGRNAVTLQIGEGPAARGQPVIVIGRGESQAVMGDEARVAVELLKNTGGFRDAVVTAEGPAPFAGGAGYVVSAATEDRTVVQYLRILPGGAYLRFLARGPPSGMESVQAAIMAVAESVEPK
jgi:hypothetical protein